MEREHFIQLIDKYLSRTASSAERRLLEEYYAQLSAKLPANFQAVDDTMTDEEAIRTEILQKITREQKKGAGYVIPMHYRKRVWVAAAFAGVVLCAGGWHLGHARRQNKAEIAKAAIVPQDDFVPGSDKAILTLGDGKRIVLDTARNGTVTVQGNMKIMKSEDGQLTYGAGADSGATVTGGNPKIVYNTLVTPRGGQYKITLSDGSRVWLNAASSLRYPSAFAGKERMVEVTGEAYFEVSPSVHAPFTVKLNGTEVQVLGTQFDIMAYENEGERHVTLVSGAVRICKENSSRILRPGQQARLLSSADNIKVVEDVDVEEVLAWKNNLFSFNDASIETVMRQLARWYDVDIKYAGLVSQHFNGNISKSVSLSRIIVMLELTGKVRFRIEGRQMIVSPI